MCGNKTIFAYNTTLPFSFRYVRYFTCNILFINIKILYDILLTNVGVKCHLRYLAINQHNARNPQDHELHVEKLGHKQECLYKSTCLEHEAIL